MSGRAKWLRVNQKGKRHETAWSVYHFIFFFCTKKMFYRKIVFQLCKCRILVTILNGNSSYGFGSFNSLVPLTNGILTLFFYFEIIGKIGCKTCGCENFWNSLPQKKRSESSIRGSLKCHWKSKFTFRNTKTEF